MANVFSIGLYRIREYVSEDSARHVDWKATAKSGSLKVREFTREGERKLCIVFDNPQTGLIADPAYEKAVDLAASLAWRFAAQNGEVSFAISGYSRTRDLYEFLGWLALIKPAQAAPGSQPSSRDPLAELNLSSVGDYNLVVTARSRGTLPAALWNCSYFVFVGKDTTPKAASKL